MCQAAMDLARAVESVVTRQLVKFETRVIICYIQHCGNYPTWIEGTGPGQKVFRRCQTLSLGLCPPVAFA